MAYTTESVRPTDRWLVGLSTDVKPTNLPLDDITTMLMETDTGDEFKWSGTQWIPTAAHGAVNVHTAHVHHKPVNTFLHNLTGTNTTLLLPAAIGATQLTLVDATGFTLTKTVHIGNGTRESTEPHIVAILGNVITIDRPLDSMWEIGTPILETEEDMSSVIGTLIAPIIYDATPDTSEVWHIQSLVLNMIHSTAADDSKFGDLPPLLNGCVLRGVDGTTGRTRTITNWKSNRDIKLDMLDVVYTDKAGAGLFGVTGDGALFVRTGAVPELYGSRGDKIQLLIQDDLTGLAQFKMKAQGHVEGK